MNAPSLDMAAAEALFAFWRDAGVDACFEAEPVDRTVFVAPVAAKGPATITPLRAPGGAPAPGEAAAEVSKALSLPRKPLYKRALELKGR